MCVFVCQFKGADRSRTVVGIFSSSSSEDQLRVRPFGPIGSVISEPIWAKTENGQLRGNFDMEEKDFDGS